MTAREVAPEVIEAVLLVLESDEHDTFHELAVAVLSTAADALYETVRAEVDAAGRDRMATLFESWFTDVCVDDAYRVEFGHSAPCRGNHPIDAPATREDVAEQIAQAIESMSIVESLTRDAVRRLDPKVVRGKAARVARLFAAPAPETGGQA
ncbi:MAG: hypothetical protein JWM76_4205 [Pseudonocardiales bacterium]|nr:hypothetical protein [Pseudonocardiales bacterium]